MNKFIKCNRNGKAHHHFSEPKIMTVNTSLCPSNKIKTNVGHTETFQNVRNVVHAVHAQINQFTKCFVIHFMGSEGSFYPTTLTKISCKIVFHSWTYKKTFCWSSLLRPFVQIKYEEIERKSTTSKNWFFHVLKLLSEWYLQHLIFTPNLRGTNWMWFAPQNLLRSGTCPEIQGFLHLKEPSRKAWKKVYFFLRRSGLYSSTKGSSKVSGSQLVIRERSSIHPRLRDGLGFLFFLNQNQKTLLVPWRGTLCNARAVWVQNLQKSM